MQNDSLRLGGGLPCPYCQTPFPQPLVENLRSMPATAWVPCVGVECGASAHLVASQEGALRLLFLRRR